MRPANVDDADALASCTSRRAAAASPAIPRPVHPPDRTEDLRSGARTSAPPSCIWVAEAAARRRAALLTGTWLDRLYVDPDRTGQGIGALLLELAKGLRPDGFGLWVFESNRARATFYARHGFVEVERTDGSENEERAPDVHLDWRG